MRVDPECVYLRLEPAVCIINRKTGAVRYVPGVEVHWKDGRRWQRRTFLASEEERTLEDALRQVAEWVGAFPALDAALAVLSEA